MKQANPTIVLWLALVATACVFAPLSTAVVSPTLVEKTIPAPTDTALPTKTLTASLTPTNTPPLIISPSATPTFAPSPTVNVDNASQTLQSPDGQWVAKLYDRYQSKTGIDTIEIQDLAGAIIQTIPFEGEIRGEDGSIQWEIPFPGEDWPVDPHPNLRIYEWSKDSEFLYFYYSMSNDGGPMLWDGYDLQQINVETGEVSKIISDVGLISFSFSPNQEYLVYAKSQGDLPQLFVRDNRTGVDTSVELIPDIEDCQIGSFTWSPYQDKELLFYTLKGEWFQAIFWDLESMSQKVIFEFFSQDYWYDVWTSDGKIRYVTLDGEITEIDIESLEKALLGTATPAPSP